MPNLLGRPFTLDDGPVVELLAQQLASPVRWIETQRALVTALGARRLLEVAPAHAAVLTGLARMTFAENAPELLHAEHDRDALLERADVPVPKAVAPAPSAPPPAAPPAADRPVDAGAALEFVLALQARVRLDQLDPSETLDELFQGVSSRRNQVLIDLGREFGLSGGESVQGQPIGELVKTLREQGAAYRFPGPYLREALGSGLSRALAPTGLTRADAAARMALGPGLTEHVLARVALDTRPGPSARGGELARLPAGPDLLERAAADLGIALTPTAAPAAAAPVVASPHLEDALLDSARALAEALGRPFAADGEPPERDDPDRARLAILDAELGPERAAAVAPRFDARRHVRFTSAWASARWDLISAYHDALAGRAELDDEVARLAGHDVAETAAWLAARAGEHDRPDVAAALARISHVRTTPDLRGEIALVTGASPGSIAAEVVRLLLRGGARVVVATSTDTPERRRFYRDLYRTSAGPDAELHVVPANLASFADIDALTGWLRRPGGGRRGRDDLELDPLTPTVVAPFAAMPTAGDAADAGAASETAIRLQLLGVERLVATLAARAPLTVLLPLSPNHGAFGGDGPYGETKAGLEVLLRRARSEPWGERATMIAPRLGWVRGTGLMGANDALAPLVEERLGVRTFAPAEVAASLIELLVARAPVEIDLTGGLSAIDDLRAALDPLAAELRERAARDARRLRLEQALATPARGDEVDALPSPGTDAAPRPLPARLPEHGLAPEDLVVIVGTGELGPGGTGATRFALELGELDSPGAVAELAWLCGLARYDVERYRGRWIDAATGEEVPEERLAERYAGAVAARVGVRALEDDGTIATGGDTVLAPVTLERELAFDVATEAEALSYSGEHTTILRDGERWRVIQRAGAQIRVPRIVAHTRRVAGQLPTGLDLARFGLPADLVATADRMALVNLACTVEAFADAGLEPEELLGAVHPSQVANTQGAGMGGMASLRRLLLDHLLDGERQSDRLQESLGNVVAAHTVQAYVGSYGPMVHPVAACATAAVSLDEAHDKIRAGKALAVVAGGYDDLTPEGMLGFADMGATASSDDLEAMGLAPHEASRANDIRRCGFVEAQGGGAQLVVRGDVALALGLPVRGVLAFAGSFGDGIHTSIPAAGLGALASAGPLGEALERHGLRADDIAVVSKHDTSTEMNDPSEADLHDRLQDALGRTPGNPLLVVSQKTVTGHAKGGAAAWQLDGVLRMLDTGTIPGNRNLESVDPLERGVRHLALGDRPIRLAAPPRAALLTSLGFGHVSAVLLVAHPDTFHASIPAAERDTYLRRAGLRRAHGARRRLETRHGRPAPVRRDRRFDSRDDEAAMLIQGGLTPTTAQREVARDEHEGGLTPPNAP